MRDLLCCSIVHSLHDVLLNYGPVLIHWIYGLSTYSVLDCNDHKCWLILVDASKCFSYVVSKQKWWATSKIGVIWLCANALMYQMRPVCDRVIWFCEVIVGSCIQDLQGRGQRKCYKCMVHYLNFRIFFVALGISDHMPDNVKNERCHLSYSI